MVSIQINHCGKKNEHLLKPCYQKLDVDKHLFPLAQEGPESF